MTILNNNTNFALNDLEPIPDFHNSVCLQSQIVFQIQRPKAEIANSICTPVTRSTDGKSLHHENLYFASQKIPDFYCV